VRAGSPRRHCLSAYHCLRHCYKHWASLISAWAGMWAQCVVVAPQQNYYQNHLQYPCCWIEFSVHPHCDAESGIYLIVAKLRGHSPLIGKLADDVDHWQPWSLAALIPHSCNWADEQYQMASALWALMVRWRSVGNDSTKRMKVQGIL